jgi:hypothetical protein
MTMSAAEILGYAASVLVAASLTMSNIRRLRWFNLTGSAAFAAYGAWLGAWPVFAVNLFVACVDIYYLERMAHQRDFFTLLDLEGATPLASKFLRFYEDDIRRYFPELGADLAARTGCFVLRNMLPVGIFVYEARPGGELEIVLDYVIPEYRDHKNGEFVFRILNERFSGERGAFVVKTTVKEHADYLRRQGFERTERDGEFRKAII